MRFRDFYPAQAQSEDLGLAGIEMPRLGQIVVLAGRNGSGKTRILGLLQDTLRRLAQFWNWKDQQIEQGLSSASNQLSTPGNPEAYIKSAQQSIEALSILRDLRRRTVFIGHPQRAALANFSPSSVISLDPSNLNRTQQIRGYKEVAETLGLDKVNTNDLTYIDFIASRNYNATHPETSATPAERDACQSAWTTLKTTVETLLPGAGLSRNSDGNITLFNRQTIRTELSNGQRALLRIAVGLHAQTTRLDEAIVILDEPENHLHPDALLEFIDRLTRAIPNGQIWIATHSIHILSFVAPECLWFIENGNASWAGRQPERVLRSLVGDDEKVGRLERFIHLPSILALERFAAECLLPPTIVMTGAEDRQSTQIRNVITRHANNEGALRVLDFGAGRGRILATLRQGRANLESILDYHALEENSEARRDCIGAIADTYGITEEIAQKRAFENEDALRRQLNGSSVDVVIMGNVLHEIHPDDWRRLFTEQVLSYSLKPGGYLLLLEDMRIPHGENAHKHGFILLDTEQLQTLFAVNREDPGQFSSHSADPEGRLKAHLIRADALKNVTAETIRGALDRRLISAGETIQRLRKEPPTFANGHLLALYTMIYANTHLALNSR